MSAKPSRPEDVGHNGFNSLHHAEESTTKVCGGGLTVHAAYSGSELFLMISDEASADRREVIQRLSRFTGHVEATSQQAGGLDSLHHSAVSDTKIDGGGLTVRVEYSRGQAFILITDEEAPSDRRNTTLNLNRNTGFIDWNSGRTQKDADKWRN